MKLAERAFKRNDYYITSPYGYRKNPVTGKNEFHNGTDYGTNRQKWAVYGIEDGTVYSIERNTGGAGNLVSVHYPRLGYRCIYMHLDSIENGINVGTKVNADTLIGYVGMTGTATGIHLHLGVRRMSDNSYMDPESIDYQPYIPPKPTQRVRYRVKAEGQKDYYEWVDGDSDYAGSYGKAAIALQIDGYDYQVHILNGPWLPKVSGLNGFAGQEPYNGKPIDGVKAFGVLAQVHLLGDPKDKWLPYIDGNKGYAGQEPFRGRVIDCVRMK